MSLAWKNVHSVTSKMDRRSSLVAARQSERTHFGRFPSPSDAIAHAPQSVCASVCAFIS